MFSCFSLNKTNYVISSSSGAYSTSTGGGSYSSVTNLSASITVSGNRAVLIGLVHDDSGSESSVQMYQPSDVSSTIPQMLWLRVKRGTDVISTFGPGEGNTAVLYPETTVQIPLGAVQVLDRPAAGTYTYTVEIGLKESVTTSVAYVNYAKLLVMEVLY